MIGKKYTRKSNLVQSMKYGHLKMRKILEKICIMQRNFSPCNVCDVKGSLIGQDHAKQIHK